MGLLLPSDMVVGGRCSGSTSLPIYGTQTRYRLDPFLLCETVDNREGFRAGYSSLNDAHILQILQNSRKSARVEIVRLALSE